MAPLDDGVAVGCFHVAQRTRCMAHQAIGLACAVKGFDQLDGCLRFGKLPQRAVATWIKNGIKVFFAYGFQRHRVGQRMLSLGVFVKAVRVLGLLMCRFHFTWTPVPIFLGQLSTSLGHPVISAIG